MIHAVDSHNSMLFGRSVGKRLLRGLGSSIGMPFINQKLPGPISNEIILDMLKKLNYSN